MKKNARLMPKHVIEQLEAHLKSRRYTKETAEQSQALLEAFRDEGLNCPIEYEDIQGLKRAMDALTEAFVKIGGDKVLTVSLAVRVANGNDLFSEVLNVEPDEAEILLNGELVSTKRMLTYEDVVAIACPSDPMRFAGASCTFTRADQDKRQGILTEGGQVIVRDGTQINICHTGSA